MFIIRPVVILIPCFHIEVLVNTIGIHEIRL